MSDQAPAATNKPVVVPDTPEDLIQIIPLHKIVFFYPTALIALICGVIMSSLGGAVDVSNPPAAATTAGWMFMAIFTLNVMIISFDFPGFKFLAVMLALVAFVLGLALVSVYYPDLLPWVGDLIRVIKPVAMPQFYYLLFAVLGGSIGAAYLVAHTTDVWYLHSNELVHKRGILGDAEKFPTMNLRVVKEITDVFEYALLGSGTLIMTPGGSERPIVLENVMQINKKEKKIRELLSKFKVSA